MKKIILFISIFGFIYSNSITEKTKSMKKMDGYLNMFWDNKSGKLWLEISDFDQEFLYVNSLMAGMGSNDVGLDRGQLGNSRIVYFHRIGPKILLISSFLNPAFRSLSHLLACVFLLPKAPI